MQQVLASPATAHPSYQLTTARTLAVIALCSVPISTAITNLACGLFALALLAAPEFWRRLPALWRHPAAMAALLLLAALAASTAYSAAGPHEAWSWTGKYLKLLIVPFAIVAFQDSEWSGTVRWSLFLTLAVILLLSTTNYIGLTSIGPSYSASDVTARALVFRNRIADGLFGALLFYMAVDFALAAASARARIAFVLIALLSFANVMIMLQGRTGQVVIILLALVATARVAWLARGKLRPRAALYSLAVLAAAIGLIVVACSMRSNRIDQVASEVRAYRQNDTATSAGLRLEWYRKSIDLFRARPLTGYGAGGLGAEFERLTKGKTGAEGVMTSNPHNEYLLMAVQLGIPGVLLFLNLLAQIARYGMRLEPHSRHLLLAWLAIFAFGSLANSLLIDFAEGHMFALLCGILLGCGYRPMAPTAGRVA